MRVGQLVVTLATGGALALAGCGGGGDARLTTEEYRAQADEICAEANERIGALGEPSSQQEFAAFSEEAVSISEQALDSLRELEPPAEIEDQVTRAYELQSEMNEIGRQIAEAAVAGDTTKVDELVAQLDPLEQESDEIAKELGLEQCGSPEPQG